MFLVPDCQSDYEITLIISLIVMLAVLPLLAVLANRLVATCDLNHMTYCLAVMAVSIFSWKSLLPECL